mmetsp:Transcript_100549/g.181499  ORF Transcript_100549/g.181499 Transcript_100549/m.181499 type:complete len:408 (+) Transcript_100549:115-1338(+)
MAYRDGGMLRSPTFFVGAEKQRKDLDGFQRREQMLAEAYHENKVLCYNARAYQKTHPVKARQGHRDADATLEAPMILGVADGVSQIEDFGIDSSELPNQLLNICEELGMAQLAPASDGSTDDPYRGPIPLVREAFESTDCLGSTTLVLALLDNSTKIHGKPHPMIAVISVGDCELLILRRAHGRNSPLELIFNTEMQRVDGHAQTPLQIARVDDRIDPNFYEGLTVEVIERGSAVHCVSAYEGDIIIMGSDGVFDNLFHDEIVALANSTFQRQFPTPDSLLSLLARQIVEACHMKTQLDHRTGMLGESPIGRGGKMDDTSCVVAEVVEWTDAHQKIWAPASRRSSAPWTNILNCGSGCAADEDDVDDYDDEEMMPPGHKPSRRGNSQAANSSSQEEEEDDSSHCALS